MGNYTKGLTERRHHTQLREGYCLICGTFGPLSWDHVPPQGSITITKVEQAHLTEIMGINSDPVIGVKSSNGSKFRTICKHCNSSHLGTNDQEVARVYKCISEKIKQYFLRADSPVNRVHMPFDGMRFCRAMVGHVLSATTVKECLQEPVLVPYYASLQNFVMGDDTATDDTHDFYVWFYPHRRHMSIKMFNFKNDGHIATLSLLSFFPLAFLITEKRQGIYPSGATPVKPMDKILNVKLDSGHLPYAAFPNLGLEGGQMILLNGAQSIVSYPI
ncbi:metal-binding protein [Pseudomonas viridiflava]|uniref:metal-binding protein n=1 Tax=Pseudomonas viridiflava TaxID=33069 RepID=UPI00211D5EAE|nr:metal-binding protein [Pseudomonas viridiflava]MCQ9393305.1 metal-binding protein [Pseudomonas viridiflava]